MLSSVSCRDFVRSGGGAGDDLAKLSWIEYDCMDKGFAFYVLYILYLYILGNAIN